MSNAVKTAEEIAIMTEGGQKLRAILKQLLKTAEAGVTGLEIDNLAKDLIKKAGGSPSFVTVADYKWATCISVNDGVVHGVPTKEPFKAGDLVSIDVGMLFNGYHTDTSWSKIIPGSAKNAQTQEFLAVGEDALKKAIAVAIPGHRVGHISQAIQKTVEAAGFHIVKSLVGHAIGKKLHENLQIPGILSRPISQTPKLEKNMTIAIEVIYSMGKADIIYPNEDGWTLSTSDGSLAGLFESTIVVAQPPIVLT